MKYLLIFLSLAAIISCENIRPIPAPGISMMMTPPELNAAETDRLDPERKLISTVWIHLEVEQLSPVHLFVDSLVREMNGYITSDDQNESEVTQTIRIPAQTLDAFTDKLSIIATKISKKEVRRQDVSEEFIDYKSRLATKKDLEKHYREILNHATKVSDMLQVEEQLEKVRGDIESMEGRMNYISNRAEFSTVNLVYSEPHASTDTFAFGSELIKSLGRGWRNMELFALKLVDQWPFILTAIGVLTIIYKRIRIFKRSLN